MPTGFHRTLRTLGADRFRPSVLGILAACALLGGWAFWMLRGSITLYEVSPNARVEIDRAASAVQAPMAGRVTGSELVIGREVKKGDVLVEVDASAEKLQLAEEQSRFAGGAREIEALEQQIGVEQQARQDEQKTAATAIDVARANVRESTALGDQAANEASRLKQLRDEKLASERDYQAAEAEVRRRRAATESLSSEVQRLEDDRRGKDSERDTRIRKLSTDLSHLKGQQDVERSTIQRLDYEIERRKVRAATNGRIGEAAIVRAGGVVSEGERLAAIVPEGRLLVVAQFPPPAALGRIRAGQKARVRLTGYPWIQYGAINSTVERVSSEVRDGAVRVELSIDPDQKTRIPLQHGLPGSVEVAVDKTSPARLLMRVAGQWISEPR